MAEFLKVAKEAAEQAGAYLLEKRGSLTGAQVDEKAKNDFVTEVDRQSEKMITDSLQKKFPCHGILAEEGTSRNRDKEYLWIVDPLDGTKNYIQQVPFFTVSIALQKADEIIAGVVYDPVHRELFTAEKNKGAFLNGHKISISKEQLSAGLVATGFPFRAKYNLPAYLLTFEKIFLACSGIRRCGSAALDLAYTAAGRFEGFWELGLKAWDIAAGSLLIREAGGLVSDFQGENSFLSSGYIVAGTPESHPKLLEIVRQHFQKRNES
ncbi:MAG: inositol monophosphatase family protein [Calditrichia bacterium]